MPFTPNFAIPYQMLTGSFELNPEGILGEDGAIAVDAALAGLDVRIDALEAAVHYTRIAESVLVGTAATITFSSIPATYRSLQLHILARCDVAATSATGHIRFNSDATAIYNTEQVGAFGASVTGAEVISGTSAQWGDIAAASATANAASVAIITIPWYTNTSFWKFFTSSQGMSTAATTATTFSKHWVGHWRSTAAINAITLLPASNNFIAGTSVALYGLP